MTRRALRRRLEKLEESGGTVDVETSITRALIMTRERAEREGREILGPADVATDSDLVRVDPNG